MVQLDGNFRRYDLASGLYLSEEVPRDFMPDYINGVNEQIWRLRNTRRVVENIKKAHNRKLAKEEASKLRPIRSPSQYSLKEIIWAVSQALDVTVDEMISEHRNRAAADARHIYYVTARNYTGASLPMIGHACGDRDHSTVMSGLERVARRRSEYQERIEAVEAKLFERPLAGTILEAAE